MTTAHTPGEWLKVGTTVYALNERGVNRFFCSVQDAHTPAAELEANARLIAAAPDLLEALKRCRFDSLNMSLQDLEFCRAAFDKATGAA